MTRSEKRAKYTRKESTKEVPAKYIRKGSMEVPSEVIMTEIYMEVKRTFESLH